MSDKDQLNRKVLRGTNKNTAGSYYRTLITDDGSYVALTCIECMVNKSKEGIDATVDILSDEFQGWFEITTTSGHKHLVSTLQVMKAANRDHVYERTGLDIEHKRHIVMSEMYEIFSEWAQAKDRCQT